MLTDTTEKKKKTDDFLKVIWKKSKKVGFGSKDDYTIAWYCSDSAPVIKPYTDASNDYYDNLETCLDKTAGKEHNKCVNAEAVKAVNTRREDHLVLAHAASTEAQVVA